MRLDMQACVVNVADTNVHYLVGGDGPPLLLIHGLGESSASFSANYAALASRFRIYAPDLPGWGQTPPSPRPAHDLESLATFVLGFLDAVSLPEAAVLGWSLGGAAVIAAAARFPHRFSKLILVASASLGPDVHWLMRLLGVPGLGELLIHPNWLTMQILYRWLYTAQPQRASKDFLRAALHKASTPWHRATTLSIVRGADALTQGQRRIDQRDLLSQLSMPVLLLWGRLDRVIPVEHGEQALPRLSRARMVVFDDCGHMPMLEDPARFDREVSRFLLDSPPAS